MDGEAVSQTQKRGSCKYLKIDVDELQDSDCEECISKRLYKEQDGKPNKKRRCFSGNSGAEPEESSGFLPDYPEERGGGGEDIQDNVLHTCCIAQDSADQASPNSMLEYWVYSDNQHNMADCPVSRAIITPPATPVTHSHCLFIPSPLSFVVNPVASPVTDTCSPSSSAWDALRSTSSTPGRADWDPVSAAAHLHLLGESLSLIGHHLQETDKMVSVPCSLSLLLDSLLCALPPLLGLSAQIPELRSCTQQTLAATLENIAYVMPGL